MSRKSMPDACRARRSTAALRAACVVGLVSLAGCGSSGAPAGEVAREAAAEASQRFEAAQARFGRRLEEVLATVRRVVPQAEAPSPEVRLDGPAAPPAIETFMSEVLDNIDGYWQATFREAELPAPSVRAVFPAPGTPVPTACGVEAGDDAAFYCPADDTMYVAQGFASALYEGTLEGLAAGGGRAAGDFAVAFVLAHEYAHNLQQELGIFANAVSPQARPFELHADCWSGAWANSVYRQGLLEEGDLQEAVDTALAVGDFDFGNAQHHGTPEERRDALLTGYRSGQPSDCSPLLPARQGGSA